jgi:3-oxoadipate enol-lactonase
LLGHAVSVAGGRVYCERDGSGLPVVLTHDALLHRESWDAQVEVLAESYEVLRWDRRGYGRSDDPAESYSSLDDLVTVVRTASDPPVVLVGCSIGALMSLHCALDHRDLVRALVLVGPILSGLALTEHFATRGGMASVLADASAEKEIDYWSETDRWFVASANVSARKRLRELLTANPKNLTPKRPLEQRLEPSALPRLAEVAVPTLVVVGELDIPDVHAHAGAIEAGIAGARRIVVSGSGHLPQLERPQEFNEILLEFLASLGT